MDTFEPMKHMIEARLGALAGMNRAIDAGLAEKLCLIVDLQGRLRILAKLSDAHDPTKLTNGLGPDLATECEAFWTNEIWFEREKTHPLGRSSPADKALFARVWTEAKPEPAGQDKVLTVDRRYSKEGWFSTNVEPPWAMAADMPPILSFYSYKGGVGRTTALAAVATQCARAGKRVVVLDFDLEAPGIGSVFAAGAAMPNCGVVDFLLEFPVLGKAFDPTEILYSYDKQPVIQDGEPIFVGAAGVVDEWYLEKLARMNYQGLSESLAPHQTRDSALGNLFHKVRAQTKPDLILIDSRAGLHDLGGLALCGLAHWHILFGLDSEQSWQGLRVAVAHLGKARILSKLPQRDCMVVQSMVPPQEGKEESVERFRLRSFDVFQDDYYDEAGDVNAEWPLPDAKATDEPHYSVPLLHDNKVMGYRDLERTADYLCEGDFKVFGSALLKKLGMTL